MNATKAAPEIEAGRVMPALRQQAPSLFRACRGSRRLAKQLRYRRADAQDLVILQLVEEVEFLRKRILQRRKRK